MRRLRRPPWRRRRRSIADWPRADPEEALRWLSPSDQELLTGVGVRCLPATAHVLHAMYARPGPVLGGPPHDDVRRQQLASGTVLQTMVGDVDLDAVTTTTGIPLGLVGAPAGWRRLRWRELARTLDVRLDPHAPNLLDPFNRALGPSWPAAIQPPPEGSLDVESLAGLLDVLARRAGPGDAYLLLTALANPLECAPLVVRAPLEAFGEVIAQPGVLGSPQNWWPADRSWLVYTDYDLSFSTVGGPPGLVDELARHPRLETLRT